MTGPDTTSALLATVGRLWPGARVELARGRRADPRARAELLVLPHSRSPRLLLPVSGRQAAKSVARFSASASPVEVAARMAASSVLRLGGGRLLPERIRVYGGDDDSLATHLARALGEPRVTFSLGIGPERVNRKPVLQVFGGDGRSRGFAKLGDSATARADVAAEAESLQRLAGHEFASLRVPRPLYAGRWRDLVVLVQEDLAVPARTLVRGAAPIPLAAMHELTTAFAGAPAPLAAMPWIEACRRRAGLAPDRAAVARFAAAVDRLVAAHAEPVPTGAWHGDWTPWNMAPAGPRVLVWDWERFETGVPQGLDPLHHAVNVATVAHGTTPRVVREALVAAGADPVGGPAWVTAGAYLVAITARYLEMSAAPDGELIVPRAGATLEALEDWLG